MGRGKIQFMHSPTISIQLNGAPQQVPAGTSISALLELLGIKAPRVAVEVNAQVVSRATHSTTLLAAGDEVEVVTFVGGG